MPLRNCRCMGTFLDVGSLDIQKYAIIFLCAQKDTVIGTLSMCTFCFTACLWLCIFVSYLDYTIVTLEVHVYTDSSIKSSGLCTCTGRLAGPDRGNFGMYLNLAWLVLSTTEYIQIFPPSSPAGCFPVQ